jgi:hypothetical protein
MFFSRRKHKLPNFPEEAIPTFRSLCEVLPDEAIPDLSDKLDEAYDTYENRSLENPLMNMRRVQQIYDVAHYLLRQYHSFANHEKSLIVGAVRYFLDDDDVALGAEFFTGFDDDAKIMNHVLEELGVEDRFIRLDGSIWR